MPVVLLLSGFLLIAFHTQAAEKPALREAPDRPNIILIFTDDQGYEDLGCFGSKTIKTPHLDRMAREGLRLTSFYAQPVCGVSRAALMTGSYPIRIGEPGNVKRLHTVPHPREVTMAEMLQARGYATALIGKWHLTENKQGAPGGVNPATMPNAQGFDYFYGTPKFNGYTVFVKDTTFRSPIFRNTEVVVSAVQDWDSITADYTREALNWIETHRDAPFFLYLAHNLPHIPVGASKAFKGRSAYGPYGDTIEEIDHSCGQIFARLKALDLDKNTLVIYTSDNGPWVETTRAMKPGGSPFIPRDHSGSAAPLRGWKMSAWEGGSRVPCIVRWPNKVPRGRSSDQLLSTMDLLPTFAALSGARLPDVRLDGRDASAFLLGKSPTSPREDYFYYAGCLLTGVRAGQWKLVLPRPGMPRGTGWWGRMIEAVEELQLFDLNADPGETTNLAKAHPELVARLQARIRGAREELGDLDQVGTGARFFDDGPRRLQVPASPAKKKRPGKASARHTKPFKPLGNLRFSFEEGTLDGWKIVDGAFGLPVSPHASLPRWKEKPYGREGMFHLSTVAGKDGFSDKQVGVIESPAFIIQGDRAAFLVSGGEDADDLYIGLFDADTDERLRQAFGQMGPQMHRVIWETTGIRGRSVRIRIVDRSRGSWGHLTFDDFSVAGSLQ
jgi:arylsulfatase